jgi:small subunit ribosomal protein S9
VAKESAPILATGRRKTSVAQVRLVPNGAGRMFINTKPVEDYFKGHDMHRSDAQSPLKFVEGGGSFDVFAKVVGGGVTGQAGAIRHGLARALATLDDKTKKAMRREGFLTRDDRMVERKKPGQPKARKRFQYSKR